jgi:ABC-type tungstate transport system permease subunit
MRHLRRLPSLAALVLLIAASSVQVTADTPFITLASTTSTEQSGLFQHIVPKFTARTGIEVRVVAVGTGQAFAIGRRGMPMPCWCIIERERMSSWPKATGPNAAT